MRSKIIKFYFRQLKVYMKTYLNTFNFFLNLYIENVKRVLFYNVIDLFELNVLKIKYKGKVSIRYLIIKTRKG